MKKVLTLNEEIKRMKSLMSEERLYGNLIDSPPKKKVITEGVPWKALWQAVKTASKETPELALTLISKSYMGKVNKALSKLPESGILAAKQAQEIMDIAKGLAKNMSVADNITKVFKLAKIPLDGPDIGSMRNMLVNMQALILRGVARGDNATIIAKDINAIAKSTSLTPQDITDFAHLVFNSTKINKILGESQLAKALEDLTKFDVEAYFKMLTTMSPGDLRGVDDLGNMITKNVDEMTEAGLKKAISGSEMEKWAKRGNWVVNFAKKGLKTLFFRLDVPPVTRMIEKFGWGRKLLQSKLLTGKYVVLANAPVLAGLYYCVSDGIWPFIKAYRKKKAGEEGVDEVAWNSSLVNSVWGCLGGYVEGSSLVVPRGVAYVTNGVLDKVYDYERATIKDLFRKWIINHVCEQTGSKKVIDGELRCDWAAVGELYKDCESLKGPNGPIEQFKKEAIEQKWYLKVADYAFKTMGVDEGIRGFKEMVEEELTNDPKLCEWFEDNLQLKWEMTDEELKKEAENMVETGTDDFGDGVIVNDIEKVLIETGMQCNYLSRWKEAAVPADKHHEVKEFDDGKEGFKNWWCNFRYGEGSEFSKKDESDYDYVNACKQAVDQWCP